MYYTARRAHPAGRLPHDPRGGRAGDPRGGHRPLQAVHARGDRGRAALVQVAHPRDDRARALPRAGVHGPARSPTRSSCRPTRGATSSCTRRSRCAIARDGDYELDYDGASAWGYHSMNCTPSAMQGAIWVQFTQTLICNDKVNDGAYLGDADRTSREGTIANLGDAEGSTGHRLGVPASRRSPASRARSRARSRRAGFVEEVLGAYARHRQRLPGRRHRPVRAASRRS